MPAASEPMIGDAFGVALRDRLAGDGAAIVIERDDGYVDVDGSDYFGDVADDPLWRWMRNRIGRRVLDVGAGAGRGALQLQSEGIDVVALDVSPGCVEVCRRRGIEKTFVGTVEQLAATGPQGFDTLLALGNNLGLIGSPETAAAFFEAALSIGGKDVRIVGTMLDPHLTDNPVHLRQHDRNRERSRLPGHVTVRVRYENLATRWFDLLWSSPTELSEICAAHGWALAETERFGILYGAELRPA